MAIINTKQISKSNNKTKLIEFNDKLQFNDFTDECGVKRTTVHGKFSRINVVIVDWTKGKGDMAVVVQHNIEPAIMKGICNLVLIGDTTEFEKQDKYTKSIGFTENKINIYQRDSEGYCPVTYFNIKFQPQMSNPWTITIETGKGKTQKNENDGIFIAKGTYIRESEAVIYLSKLEMHIKMLDVLDTIRNFETTNYPLMIKKRDDWELSQVQISK